MSLAQATAVKIKNLRSQGHSVPEISRECQVPKSTVSRHVKGTDILPEYYPRWLERRNASKIISERNWKLAFQKAEQVMPASLTKKELALIAASLYWAEGAKRDFSFSNTDPEMIKVFISILKNIFQIKNEDLKISIRIYEDLDKTDCLRYWSGITGVILDHNTSVNVLKGSKKGKLQYGMCRIRVRRSGLLLKEFFAIIRRISEFTSLSSRTVIRKARTSTQGFYLTGLLGHFPAPQAAKTRQFRGIEIAPVVQWTEQGTPKP